jgi:hypothetical protein
MTAIMKHRPREHHRIYKRQYSGKGFGSFLKSALSSTVVAAKSGLKSVGKVVKAGAKSLAKATVTHLAPVAKDLLKQGTAAAKEVGTQALAATIEGAKEIAAKQAQNLVVAIATADNIDDVKKAFKTGAEDFKEDVKSLGRTVVKDAKANSKHHAKQIGVNAVTQTLGLPTIEVSRHATANEMEEAAAEAAEEQAEAEEEGSGLKKRRKTKKSKNLSELLAKADLNARKTVKGGAAFVPGTATYYG